MNNVDGTPLKTPFRPLRHFLWVFVLAVVLPGMLLGLALAWWSARQLVERQEQQAVHLASAAAESMGNHLKTLFTGISVLSQLPLGKDHFPDFYRVAKAFSANEGYNVTLADSEGNQFLSTRLPLGTTLPRRDAMDSVRKAVASGHAHASEVFTGKITGSHVVTVDAPVSTSDGLRVITLAVDAKAVAQALARTALPEGWLMALIDEQGVFIARSKDQDQWIGKPTRPELIDASRRTVSGMIYNKSVEGVPILNVFNRVPGADWKVLVGIPKSVLYAPVVRPVGLLAGLVLLAAVLTALLAFLFYRRLNFATARLLTIARDPLRSDEGTTARSAFAEFEAITQILKTTTTQQQRLIAELSESEKRYHTLFNSIDEGFCIIEMIYDEHENPIDWRYLEVNPAFEKHNGLREATGKRMRELAPNIEPYWFEIYGKVARMGEPTRFQNEAKALGARWFDLYAFRIGGPDSHKVAVIFKDITEGKLAEASLHEQERLYHSVVSALSEGIALQGRDNVIATCNPAAERILGLSGDQLRGLKDFDPSWQTIHEDGTPFPLETHPSSQVLRTGVPQTNVIMGIRKSAGATTWISINAVPIFDSESPSPSAVVVSFSDVTEQSRLYQALQARNTDLEAAKAVAEEASLAKSNFLSSMSHELRTPLNAILGFAQLMESSASPPTPSQKRSIDQILAAGWHLLELVNEILDLAQIESGRVALSREAVPLENVMIMCKAMVEPLAYKRGIVLNFPPFDVPYFVYGDRIRIKQVLINLIYNAIKYNKPAGTVTVECTLAPQNSIRISVRDTGPGLAPEQLAQLFQPFNRLGKEAGTEQGTGIGLVVSKRLVELMGGVIGVESTVGVGSVFWIELSLTAAPLRIAGEAEPTAMAKPQPPDRTGHRTVLYVEDNPANLQLVEELMKRRPELRLISAADGNLGVEYARTYLPEVILMDLHLPGIGGIEAMKVLRADPSTAQIPVIAVSAYALPGDIEKALEAGFFNYVTKPIRVNEFMAALDVALESSRTKSALAATKAQGGRLILRDAYR